MLVNDILNLRTQNTKFQVIVKHCSDFIKESNGLPLYKNLPTSYNDIHKVKVRLHKKKNKFTETFNQAFNDEITNLRQRAIFASSISAKALEENDTELFYVFPINNYKFIYNKEVTNSNIDYKNAFDTILEQLDGKNKAAIDIITDLLKYTYTSNNLIEGIQNGSEIILYNVPYYYATRTSVYPNYSDLLTFLA